MTKSRQCIENERYREKVIGFFEEMRDKDLIETFLDLVSPKHFDGTCSDEKLLPDRLCAGVARCPRCFLLYFMRLHKLSRPSDKYAPYWPLEMRMRIEIIEPEEEG